MIARATTSEGRARWSVMSPPAGQGLALGARAGGGPRRRAAGRRPLRDQGQQREGQEPGDVEVEPVGRGQLEADQQRPGERGHRQQVEPARASAGRRGPRCRPAPSGRSGPGAGPDTGSRSRRASPVRAGSRSCSTRTPARRRGRREQHPAGQDHGAREPAEVGEYRPRGPPGPRGKGRRLHSGRSTVGANLEASASPSIRPSLERVPRHHEAPDERSRDQRVVAVRLEGEGLNGKAAQASASLPRAAGARQGLHRARACRRGTGRRRGWPPCADGSAQVPSQGWASSNGTYEMYVSGPYVSQAPQSVGIVP